MGARWLVRAVGATVVLAAVQAGHWTPQLASPPVHVLDVVPASGGSLVTAAVQLASLLRHDKRKSVHIRLHRGHHRVPPGGLVLGAEHSPAVGHRVTWTSVDGRGEATVTSAVPVTGWTTATTPAWLPPGTVVAAAPSAALANLSTIRHLWVDGVRASRTRVPVGTAVPGGLALAADGNGYIISGTPSGPSCAADHGTDQPCCGQGHGPVKEQFQCPATTPTCVGYVYDSHFGHCVGGAAPNGTRPAVTWANPGEVEFVYSGVAQGWSEARCAVHALANGSSGQEIQMRQPCFFNLVNRAWQPVNGNPPKYADNIFAELSQPGQFYYDGSSKRIFYVPLPGQDMSKVEAVVASEETLITIGPGAANHHWDGVSFQYATWLRPGLAGGFVEQQTAACDLCTVGDKHGVNCGSNDTYVITPGNVVVAGASDVEFTNCTFAHLGAYAAAALGGAQRVAWRGCRFVDVSAGAVMLGDITNTVLNETDPSKWDRDFVVEDCQIVNIPVEYTGATGVFAGYVHNTTIAHNHFANQTYSGMTIGWGWGRTGGGRGRNSVVGNLIERPTTVRCCDGGAIYTLGPQPGSVLTRNYIVNPNPALGPSNCIYHDNGSGGFNDSANVCQGRFSNQVAVNSALGGFGPCGKCPSFSPDTPADCTLVASGNYFATDRVGTSYDRVALGGRCSNVHVTGNTDLPMSAPLPAAAAAIAADAGPRY